MQDNTKLRQTFNKEAQLYNDIRPRYPDALFDTLIRVTDLPANAKMVEIGPGTGQATKSLAERGYKIIAIELGADLADVARRELRSYPNAEVITGAFEDVDLPAQAFDLVYAATAFHWVDPKIRYAKPYKILKPDGHLAIIHTNHFSDQRGDVFFNASRPIYDRYFEVNKEEEPVFLPRPDENEPPELDEKLFELIHFQRFPEVIKYTSKEYARLINTYSPTLALPEDKRTAFLKDIETLINEHFNGVINKLFYMSLAVAKKK